VQRFKINTRDLGRQVNRILIAQKKKFPTKSENGHFQQSISINVWVAIVENHLVGCRVLPCRLNGGGYLPFLNEVLPELLKEIPLAIRRQMWCTASLCSKRSSGNL
jgi:hypothetical protein